MKFDAVKIESAEPDRPLGAETQCSGAATKKPITSTSTCTTTSTSTNYVQDRASKLACISFRWSSTLTCSCTWPSSAFGFSTRKLLLEKDFANRLRRVFILFLCLALCWIFHANLRGEDALNRLIDAIQKRYNSIGSFKADFVQIYRTGFSEEQESGTLYMKKPGKMRWEYTTPTAKLFIADGKKTYFYVPRDKQVSVADWDADSASTPLLFLLGRGDLKKDFDSIESKDAKLADGDTVLLLTPKVEQSAFKEILLEVRRKDADIVRLTVLEHNGSRNDYLLRSFHANINVAEDKFRFKIPKGVEVIRQ